MSRAFFRQMAKSTRVDDVPSVSKKALQEAGQIFEGHLAKLGLKQTGQRRRILQVFLGTREHLSIDELYQLVKKLDPKVGVTTIYRTLKLFSQCGIASEVELHDGISRYEPQLNRRSHHHMVCTDCGDSVEFFSPEIEQVEVRIGTKFRYSTTRHFFQIFGLCARCSKKAQPAEK